MFLAARRLEVDRSAEGGLLKGVAVALTVGLALGWYLFDRDYTAAREEDGTVRLAGALGGLSGPGDGRPSGLSGGDLLLHPPTAVGPGWFVRSRGPSAVTLRPSVPVTATLLAPVQVLFLAMAWRFRGSFVARAQEAGSRQLFLPVRAR